jgi:hypothetical protein
MWVSGPLYPAGQGYPAQAVNSLTQDFIGGGSICFVTLSFCKVTRTVTCFPPAFTNTHHGVFEFILKQKPLRQRKDLKKCRYSFA